LDQVATGVLSGNVVTLELKEPSNATKITCLKETAWSQEKLVIGASGIAALNFCDVVLQ